MTTTTATTDPRLPFAEAVALAGKTIAAVTPDQMANPTPCGEYDVRQVLGHLVSVMRRLAAVGRGESPFGVEDVSAGIADDGWSAAWSAAVDEFDGVWADDAVLAKNLVLPWAEMPGSVALPIYVSELSVHTWDLATGTGQAPAWDDDVLQVAYDAMQTALPREGRQAPPGADFVFPFDDVVETPADAPLIDRLVAWNGRKP